MSNVSKSGKSITFACIVENAFINISFVRFYKEGSNQIWVNSFCKLLLVFVFIFFVTSSVECEANRKYREDRKLVETCSVFSPVMIDSLPDTNRAEQYVEKNICCCHFDRYCYVIHDFSRNVNFGIMIFTFTAKKVIVFLV